MILFLAVSLLILPSNARFVNTPREHLSEYLRIKCDALPYRTAFIGTRCYFAVIRKVPFSEAPALCTSIFPGSQISIKTPTSVFLSMMIDAYNFHNGKSSSDAAKQLICSYDMGYKCEEGEESGVIPGKCVARSDTKKTYPNALIYCDRLGMELPTVDNELENRMFVAVLKKEPAWVRNVYQAGADNRHIFRPEKSFTKYSTCDVGNPLRIFAGWQMHHACTWTAASVIDRMGCWGNTGQETDGYNGYLFDVICTKDAVNAFTEAKIGCARLHTMNKKTGVCEWTGDNNACFQTIDWYNRTWFFPMPGFPNKTHGETTDLGATNDWATKVIVRRGCMFLGHMHPRNGAMDPANIRHFQERISVNYRTYGEWNVPSLKTGELDDFWDGMSRAQCFCDPTEATLNGHVPAPPPNKKCVEHHVFSEETQTCEWKWESKFCGELITFEGRRMMLEIPNWPINRKYDAEHWNNETIREENFHITVSQIIVRQHCWATLYWRNYHERQTLPTTGYGKHTVASYFNGVLGSPNDGTHRVVCECIR